MKTGLSNKKRNALLGAASVLCMLLLWDLAALKAGSPRILPSVKDTAAAVWGILSDLSFISHVGTTLLRAAGGFAASCACAVALGIPGGLHPGLDSFLRPVVSVVRSTPAVVFIVVALIWLGTDIVPVFIGFLVMFPVIYMNIVEGMRAVDPKLVQMARFYNKGTRSLVRDIYIPSIKPFLRGGICTAAGLGWKTVVAGEVLSQPRLGIGSAIHSSQIFLCVDILLAWTVVAIVVSFAFDALIRLWK